MTRKSSSTTGHRSGFAWYGHRSGCAWYSGGHCSCDTFGVCFECRAGEHPRCVGVPCECECDYRPPATTDAEVVAAFSQFLSSVGPAIPGERTVVKETQAMLAALDVLDPDLAERISRKIAEANDG